MVEFWVSLAFLFFIAVSYADKQPQIFWGLFILQKYFAEIFRTNYCGLWLIKKLYYRRSGETDGQECSAVVHSFIIGDNCFLVDHLYCKSGMIYIIIIWFLGWFRTDYQEFLAFQIRVLFCKICHFYLKLIMENFFSSQKANQVMNKKLDHIYVLG